jgi:hypothetical protein
MPVEIDGRPEVHADQRRWGYLAEAAGPFVSTKPRDGGT